MDQRQDKPKHRVLMAEVLWVGGGGLSYLWLISRLPALFFTGAGRSSEVERSLMVRWSSDRSFMGWTH